MKLILLSFVASLLTMLIIDGAWLATMMKRFYAVRIGHLLSDSPQIFPVVVFYLVYALGLTMLVLLPAIEGNYSLMRLLLSGALFGLVAYGTYDLTNQATMKAWPLMVTIVDMIWGASLTGVVSVIAVYITKYFS